MPGRTHANVVVAIAVPVVDVEAILIEVADARNVANFVGMNRRERILLISIYVTED